MDLPIQIKRYIENELIENNKNLHDNAKKISVNYRKNAGKGDRLLSSTDEAVAYAISRMPSTFGAVYNSLKHTLEIYNPEIKTVADVGAGTGSVTIAVNELLDAEKIECFEREKSMQEIGQKIFENCNISNTKWTSFDIYNDNTENKYDLTVTSYMLNEIKIEDREKVIQKLWDMTNRILLIVEPGTMQGYKNIIKAKEQLISLGAKVIAPCMSKECRLKDDDWCNFYCRVQRTRIHKELKDGDAPYEDEKYMYIAVTKDEFNINDKARILRHPIINSGFIKLKVCDKDEIKELTITKKDKEKFKIARKADAGDLI